MSPESTEVPSVEEPLTQSGSPCTQGTMAGWSGDAGTRASSHTGCAAPSCTAQEPLTKQQVPKESTLHSGSKLRFSLTSDLEVALDHKIKNISLEEAITEIRLAKEN